MSDNSEKIAVAWGVIIGVIITIGIFFIQLYREDSRCRKQHDVYDCQRIYIPVEVE